MSTDVLSPLFRGKPSPGARFGQGKLLAWDPDTFENVVKWQGVELRNLPVLAGVEALTFQSADQLVLVGWDQSGRRGTQDWAIWSRAIDPGSGAAEQAIAWMQTTLAEQISAAVFGQRVHADSVDAEVTTSSVSYVSLADGPTVPDVPVSASGVALVGVGASILVSTQEIGAPNFGEIGYVSYEISGATSRSPTDTDALRVGTVDLDANSFVAVRGMAWSVETGLNEGDHTFAARYRVEFGDAVDFTLRRLIVIGL